MDIRKYTWICVGLTLCALLHGQDQTLNLQAENTKDCRKFLEYRRFEEKGGPAYIQSIDVEAYAQEHGVTPEQFVYKVVAGCVCEEDVQHYVTYRTAYRVQQRFQEGNYHREFMLSVAKYYTILWDTNQSDAANLANILLPNGGYVQDLGPNCLGQHSNKTSAIYINRRWLYPDRLCDTLLTIEHEITHSEHSLRIFPNRIMPTGPGRFLDDSIYAREKFNTNEDSHFEYEADWEAARFVPLYDIIQGKLEVVSSQSRGYYYPRPHTQKENITYPPMIWQRNILADRTKRQQEQGGTLPNENVLSFVERLKEKMNL